MSTPSLRRALPRLLALFAITAPTWAQTKLLRFPDLHGDSVVFCYAGDLWVASTDGGTARRLTAHPGLELFPKISPDGTQVAFTGQYEGDEQVYVIPLAGGRPKRLTWYPADGPFPARWGYDHHVYGWTPDGRGVLFRSVRDSHSIAEPRLFTVSVEGGLPSALPMPVAGSGSFSGDGRRLAYTPLFRDFRSWKRYEGGWAQDIYTFDLATNETRNISNHVRSDRDPMWVGDGICFSSDRDDKLNLYRFDTKTAQLTQLTSHTDWDVRWPESDGQSRIVYELGGELRILEIASGTSRPLSIFVPEDGLSSQPELISVSDRIEDYDLSPGGERALFVARGDVFSAPSKDGRTRNLSRTPGAHEREASWSPDGHWVAYVSDISGEEEIWRTAQDGSGEPERLTENDGGRLYDLVWSPDSESIAYSDKEGRLKVLDLESRGVHVVHDEIYGRIADHSWSPRSGYLAFSASDATGYRSIYIWSRANGETRRITDEYFTESSPTWDPEGNFLYFLADHSFAPQICSIEWNFAVDRETNVYALGLRKDSPHPFPPKNDEVDADKEEEGNEDEGDEKEEDSEEEEETGPISIDFDGLAERVARFPIAADNIGSLQATKNGVLFTRGGPFYYGRSADVSSTLLAYSIEDREETEIAKDISGWALSADLEKVLVRRSGAFEIYPSAGGEAQGVSTDGLVAERVPREEWAVIFDEVWRRFRDYFYVENMHGYDWNALREQYRPLLAHVAHRSDLNYLISEMIGELNVSHAYIAGGDENLPDRTPVALPGARFVPDEASGLLRIGRILPGQNTESRYRSPLTELGVDVAEGDYVLSINGQSLRLGDNPYRLLRNPSGQHVELQVSSTPSLDDARTVYFEGLSSESSLHYLNWVAGNRRRVAEATDGRVGYLHVPDMGANGIREFIKWYYGQVRKEGLVIDVRGNGGGNVSQMLIERLSRKLLGLDYARANDHPFTYPAVVFHGHMVCLLNEHSASDGDIFPWTFRRVGLGPLIGKRSWGGIIGISGHGPLMDGGSVSVPQYGNAAPDGTWAVEGYGVAPDIEVENDPAALLAGRDPQLERGIQEVLARMAAEPKALAPAPEAPVKSY